VRTRSTQNITIVGTDLKKNKNNNNVGKWALTPGSLELAFDWSSSFLKELAGLMKK